MSRLHKKILTRLFGAKFTSIWNWLKAKTQKIFFWLPGVPNNEQKPEAHEDHKLLLAVVSPHFLPRLRQLRYASRVLSRLEKRVALAAILLLLASSLVSLGVLISQRTIEVPVSGGTLKEALIGEPKFINPVDAPANDVDRDLSSLIYSGLFRLNGLDAVPDLAEKYEWSSDGKILSVTLREGVYFHNGDPLTTEDIQFTIDSVQDPARGSPLAPRFRGIKTVVLDSRTIHFVLERPDITLLTALTVGVLPARKWQDIPAANARLADLNLKPVGSGPYRFKSFTRDSRGFIRSYTLENFDRYYGIKPFIKTLTFQFYADRQEAENALRGELVDALAFVNLNDNQKSESTRWQMVELELPQTTVAFFNLKSKLMSNEKIRQALAGTVDRQKMIEVWKNSARPVSDPLPFVKGSSTSLELEEARKLLDAAGWALPPEGSVRVASSTRSSATTTELTVNIITSDQPRLVEIAEILKRGWSLLGVRVVVEALSSEELLRRATRERSSEVILTTILLNAERDLFPFWWSGQAGDRGLNLSGLSDRDVDNALELTRAATNTASLDEARRNAALLIKRSTPAAFLLQPYAAYYVSKKINGVKNRLIIARPADRFNDLLNWYVKTGWRWR